MPVKAPDFTTLLQGARRTAAHLELRDNYRTTGEAPGVQLIRETAARGVVLRRARITDEPGADAATLAASCAAGELVRWLPRTRASGIALPGRDFWLIDTRLVLFHWYADDGAWAGHHFTGDPGAVRLCSAAFEAVWARALPHAPDRAGGTSLGPARSTWEHLHP
ncbi:hypothetical protein OG500_24085 [Kitasatospora sp. NBC_01250]|uniref:DUF6879 family protein n=1 Tax=unclassified Kitasatospora TaxID=2633591 RepID=UPI002E10ED2B|nr:MULTISPECIES: DUF6879 family protein [unclassified Kitasatospora]WSJ69213.1 hypothetical protein OG294_25635 [Kitasatospora sp. NBC_01302]